MANIYDGGIILGISIFERGGTRYKGEGMSRGVLFKI